MSHRESLKAPFFIWKRTDWTDGNRPPNNSKDSGPYLSLHDAWQVLQRRRRETGFFWVEDSNRRLVDFDQLNKESKK